MFLYGRLSLSLQRQKLGSTLEMLALKQSYGMVWRRKGALAGDGEADKRRVQFTLCP